MKIHASVPLERLWFKELCTLVTAVTDGAPPRPSLQRDTHVHACGGLGIDDVVPPSTRSHPAARSVKSQPRPLHVDTVLRGAPAAALHTHAAAAQAVRVAPLRPARRQERRRPAAPLGFAMAAATRHPRLVGRAGDPRNVRPRRRRTGRKHDQRGQRKHDHPMSQGARSPRRRAARPPVPARQRRMVLHRCD